MKLTLSSCKGRIGDIIIIAIAVIALGGSLLFWYADKTVGPTPERSDDVADFVKEFGGHLQNVSLLAPAATVKTAMDTEYGPYVSPALLTVWETNPRLAPGRLTSSPWPASIKVSSVQNVGVGTYIVKGRVIDVVTAGTTTQKVGETSILLGVTLVGTKWQITEYATTSPQ